MNNIMEERKRLAIEATKRRLMEESTDDFQELRREAPRLFWAENEDELDRLTVELLKVVELKKIAIILAEKE